ncbi:hypothetical protein EDB85DRAFT_1895372 [Lactarius pseudohatsudake]|nr:hypothetical protein EDB85DRAFT_1895372 [Lactarius pseudohatsudake]
MVDADGSAVASARVYCSSDSAPHDIPMLMATSTWRSSVGAKAFMIELNVGNGGQRVVRTAGDEIMEGLSESFVFMLNVAKRSPRLKKNKHRHKEKTIFIVFVMFWEPLTSEGTHVLPGLPQLFVLSFNILPSVVILEGFSGNKASLVEECWFLYNA